MWALELFSCFTKDGCVDCSVQATYEPIQGKVYLHWDRSCEGDFAVSHVDWTDKFREELERIHKDGKGLALTRK